MTQFFAYPCDVNNVMPTPNRTGVPVIELRHRLRIECLTQRLGNAKVSPMPQPPTDEITTREALVILGYTEPSTIARYVGYGKLKPSRKLPGKSGAYLFWRHDVERLRDAQAAERAS